jgi:hypothetical protein
MDMAKVWLTTEQRAAQKILLSEYGYEWRREGQEYKLVGLNGQVYSLEYALADIKARQERRLAKVQQE